MISIASLIYKSKRFADAVYESIMEFTPLIHEGKAEFFFVANDASEDVIEHLAAKGYKYFINNNPRLTEQELFARGIGWPEYIHRVYRGWNEAIRNAQDVVVLVNSDNLFSPNWLENLLKYLTPTRIVCSQLVERRHPKYGVIYGAIHGEFGHHPDSFKKAEFLEFCKKVAKPGLRMGGVYMPCMFYKDAALKAGLYPEGNICGETFYRIVRYGDQDFFLRLAKIGVHHVTALDSIVYHFKEGEMEE